MEAKVIAIDDKRYVRPTRRHKSTLLASNRQLRIFFARVKDCVLPGGRVPPNDESIELEIALALLSEAKETIFRLARDNQDSTSLTKAWAALAKADRYLLERRMHITPDEDSPQSA